MMKLRNRILAILFAGVLAIQVTGCAAQREQEAIPVAETALHASFFEGELPLADLAAATATQAVAVTSTATKLNTADFTLLAYRNGFHLCDYQDPETVKSTFAKLINANTHTVKRNHDSESKSEGDFLVIFNNDEKHQYTLAGGDLIVDNVAYSIGTSAYNQLVEMFGGATRLYYAQWLTHLNPDRVTGMRYQNASSDGVKRLTNKEDIACLAREIKYLRVADNTGATSPYVNQKIKPGKSVFRLYLDFDNGTGKENDLFYTLTFNRNTLTVESSDMGFSCTYTLYKDQRLYFEGLAKSDFVLPPQDYEDDDNIEPGLTGKPVIYLYPQQTQDVSVQLDFKGKLGYTFPTYRDGGWKVTARPDGTLTNKADGSTHYYLFWDGVPDRTDWDFSEGFVVKGSETEAFLKEKLPAMGLLPKEYNDFITYWVPLMGGNAYNLITFSTTQYEQTAPLTVTPAPDTVLRVHMVYKPLSEPVAVKEQALPAAPVRNGFTVVEWGGTRIG